MHVLGTPKTYAAASAISPLGPAVRCCSSAEADAPGCGPARSAAFVLEGAEPSIRTWIAVPIHVGKHGSSLHQPAGGERSRDGGVRPTLALRVGERLLVEERCARRVGLARPRHL